MDTPSKKLERSTMTHEEEEEIQHDMSKLREKVQQIKFSQRVTKNELEVMMNVQMDGLEVKIKRDLECFKDGLKEDMGFFKVDMDVMIVKLEGLTKLLQERLPSGDKVIMKIMMKTNGI